jgi:hypothetical protein
MRLGYARGGFVTWTLCRVALSFPAVAPEPVLAAFHDSSGERAMLQHTVGHKNHCAENFTSCFSALDSSPSK